MIAIKGMCFRKKDEDIFECYRNNGGLLVVYGATYWAGILASKREEVKIDYFCDKRANEISCIQDVPVINSEQLEKIVNESRKRATIIICVGLKESTVISIYKDLAKLSMEADVFNYFENLTIFKENSFIFNQKEYLLFEHSFNCGYHETRMTERSVELSIAIEYLKSCQNNVVEIGAVTPYYFCDRKITDIIDPTDPHNRVNLKTSMFHCDLRGKDVLSISTVEHIGTQKYGMNEKETAVDAIEKIRSEARHYFITAPLGYNQLLDEWVKENIMNPEIRLMRRGINNHWTEIENCVEEIEYTPLWANGLIIISNRMLPGND